MDKEDSSGTYTLKSSQQRSLPDFLPDLISLKLNFKKSEFRKSEIILKSHMEI